MKKSFIRIAALLLVLCCGLLPWTACDKDPLDGMPYTTLSEYGLFAGPLADLAPADGVLPYDLNSPLFSDYAGKARLVYVPPGSSATYTEDGVIDFPVGTIIVKTFYFSHDLRDPNLGRDILETRLLVRKSAGWQTYSYLWNEAQTEATYGVAGGQRNVSWIHFDGSTRSTNYIIPNKNQCKGCHNVNENIQPIGPKTRNINKLYPYADGTANQLAKWQAMGILSGAPADPSLAPRVPNFSDPNDGTLDQRARAYLDINCAHCHNLLGPANNTGLLLDWGQTDSTALGFCKTPVAAGQGSGGLQYDILAGHPESSIMVYRMNSTNPAIAMPELARSVIHEEGVQLIRDWISSLSGECN